MSDTQQEPSIRETLTAAFDKQPTAPAPTTPAPAQAPRQESKPAPSAGRDEVGRFAPKPKEEPHQAAADAHEAQPVQQEAGAETPAAKPEAPTRKPPQSWKPAVREKWSTLPPEVQEEVERVDREVQKTLRETAQARKVADSFDATVAPYRAFLGAEPMSEVRNLLQTAVTLRTGTQQQKAAMVAQVVQAFGVDVAALDAALSGQQPQPGAQQAPGQSRDPRLDALLSHLGQQKTLREQQTRQRLQQELDTFAAQAEFYEDVRGLMGTLMEAAVKEGRDMSLKEAYDAACYLDTGIRATLQKRESATPANGQQPSTQQARAAASSVRSEPGGPVKGAQPTTIRGALEAAFAAHSRR